ncbi:hypothetical protein [Sphingomonas aerolata]|uniref:hypothetical protein n=1 Tax=Sphingomonas aerolata TaxID=185951 RepID=UPI0033477386
MIGSLCAPTLALLPKRANANPLVILAVIQAAQMVISWMTPAANPTAGIMQALSGVTTQLAAINSSLQQALAAVQDLKFYVGEEIRRSEQHQLNKVILGAYAGFFEEQKTLRYRSRNRLPYAQNLYNASLRKLYDDVKQARREALFQRQDEYMSAALTLCMAQACEIDLALALDVDDAEIHTIAEAYVAWMNQALDENQTGSVAAVRVLAEKSVDDKVAEIKKLGESWRIVDMPSGRYDLECSYRRLPSKQIIEVFDTAVVSLANSDIREGYRVWRGNVFDNITTERGVRYDGKTKPGINHPEYTSYIPSIEACQVPATMEEEFATTKERLRSKANQWQVNINDLNERRWKAAALRKTEESCRNARNVARRLLAKLDAPSRIVG